MVSTDSSCRTVFEAFLEMNLGSELFEIDNVKQWVSECMPNGLESDSRCTFSSFINCESNDSYKTPNLSDVETILGVFEKHKDDLIKMLVLLNYTCDVAEKTIACIIEDFQSSLVESRLLPIPDSDKYFEVIVYDVSLFGRYLSSALCNGMHCRIVLFSEDVLIPFYCFFLQKCYESSIPFILSLDTTTEQNVMEKIQIPCPMIIFEDADIASAVFSFCKSISKFNTNSPDVVSHLFIQESIFDDTISLLESGLKKMKHGPRLDKKTDLEHTLPSDEIETSSHNLKVFTPCMNSPIKLFVGWSPSDTDQSHLLRNSRGHVPTIPFRNSDDLGSLLKELQLNIWFHNSLSVWSENMSNIRSFPYYLQLSTLWINTHGITKPSMPCVIHKHLPINFIMPVYRFYKEFCEENEVIPVNSSVNISKPHYNEGNLPKALEDALKTFKTWHSNKAEIKLKILEPVCKVFTTSLQGTQSRAIRPGSKSVNEMIKHAIDTSTDSLASKTKIMTEYHPVGVVLVYILTLYKELEIDLNRLISSLLIQGNTVVVASSKNILNQSAYILKEIYEMTSSNSLLTFLEFTKNQMRDCKILPARCIYIGHNINSPYTRDNYNEYLVAEENNYLHDDYYCLKLSTISKCTLIL